MGEDFQKIPPNFGERLAVERKSNKMIELEELVKDWKKFYLSSKNFSKNLVRLIDKREEQRKKQEAEKEAVKESKK